MTQHLETSEELTSAMAQLSRVDALAWFTDWLARRDSLQDQISLEDLASALETLARELRGEAELVPDARTEGLEVAATVLTDSAQGVRVGDRLR